MKIRPEINSGLYRIGTHDLCNTGVDYSSLHGFIWNRHNNQLPVGLLAQLVHVKHSTITTEAMGSNQVWA